MDLFQPSIMSRIVDDGVLGVSTGGIGDTGLILRLGLAMIGLVLFGGFCGAMSTVFVFNAAQRTGNDIRKDCFRNIMTFSFPQVDRFGTGSLVTRMTNDITQVQNLVAHFARGMVRTCVMTLGSIYFMFRLNTQFGIIVLVASPIIASCMVICFTKANPLLPKLQSQLDKINSILQEDVSGIRVIKACVREIYEKLRFGKANDEQIKTQLQVLVIFAFMNPVMNALMYGVVVIILFSGSNQVASGVATPGAIMAAITYTTQLLNGISMLSMLSQNFTKGIVSWRRVREILSVKPDLADGGFDGDTQVRGKIELRNVSFSFPGAEQRVLSNINLTVQPGETLAVMGATGCGKTALVSLIPRFYDATEGSVLIDDVDVKDYNQQALRDKIAIALQKSELFGVSITENISWGKPGASEEEIRSAAQIAQADGFIQNIPEGYEAVVAERGNSLSGGQKQRVAISRAVLRDAEILIFDDSTSALDLKTEAALYEALSESGSSSTKILIAQRIASVRRADRIVVLNDGGIEACGTHDELMKSSATYQDIYNSQIGSEDESL